MKAFNHLAGGALLTLAALALTPVSLAGGHSHDIPITTSSKAAKMDFIAGQAAMDVGNGIEANALFRAAVEKDPDFAYAWLNVGNNALSGQEFVTATKRASELADKVSDGERLLIAINMRFMDNNFTEQVKMAEQLVQDFPNSARAWMTLAGAQNNIEQYDAARTSMRKAIEISPNFAPAYVGIANSYVFNDPKNFDKAAEYFEDILMRQPYIGNHYWGLGDVYRADGDLASAREYYTRSVMIDPGNATAYTKRAHVNSFLGNFDEARADYDKAAEVGQPGAVAFLQNYKYFTYVYEGHADKAVAGLTALHDKVDTLGLSERQRDGAKNFTLTNAAMISMHNGMPEHSSKLLAMRSENLRETAAVAGTEEFGDIQEANIAYFDGLAAARSGKLKEAKKFASMNAKLVKKQDNPLKMQQYHDLMGLVLLKEKKYGKAVDHYRQANLNNIYTKYHLGLALEGAGKQAEAKAIFKDVANWNFNSVGYALIRADAMKKIS